MSNSMVAESWQIFFFQFHFLFILFLFCFFVFLFFNLVLFYFFFFRKLLFPFFCHFFHFISFRFLKLNQMKTKWPRADITPKISSMLDIKRYKKLRYFTCSTWKTMNQVLLFIKKIAPCLHPFHVLRTYFLHYNILVKALYTTLCYIPLLKASWQMAANRVNKLSYLLKW